MEQKISEQIHEIINDLFTTIKKNGYKGIDPYDCLNSSFFNNITNKWIKIVATQQFLYSPLNFRKFFGIRPSINPKAMGLLLSSLCLLKKKNLAFHFYDLDAEADYIYHWLHNNANTNYSGLCWGYNFPWQDLHKYIPAHEPSIVCTSYIGHAFLDYYEITKNKKITEDVNSICGFILNDLHVYQDKDGVCLSYSPFDNTIVHNANLLGASLLARAGALLKDTRCINFAKECYQFTLQKQNSDGSWYYSINPETQQPRIQLDFHQGFIIECLLNYLQYIEKEDKILEIIDKAVQCYSKQFTQNGRSFWRYPTRWPVDTHHQAQGIITYTKLFKIFHEKQYCELARNITNWTLQNMYNQTGYFYYQKWPFITNKIPYLRWGQAWMMLALSEYFSCI